MSMQDRFREKAVKRANEARARSTLKAGQKDLLEAEKAMANLKAEEGLPDDSPQTNDLPEPGLPGGVDDADEDAQVLKPAVAG